MGFSLLKVTDNWNLGVFGELEGFWAKSEVCAEEDWIACHVPACPGSFTSWITTVFCSSEFFVFMPRRL